MKIFVCTTCGHVEFDEAPQNCPVCSATRFDKNDNLFKESEEKSKEASPKHIPNIVIKKPCGLIPEQSCTDLHVRIGEVLHPMQDNHYIRFIDCYIDGKYIARQFLTPNINPAAAFHLKEGGSKATIVENCNVHGYWMAEKSID